MRVIILSFFVFFSGFILKAERVLAAFELQRIATDSSLNASIQLFSSLKDEDSLQSVKYGQLAIRQAIKNEQDSIACHLYYELGRSLMLWGNLDASQHYFESLIEYALSQNNLRGEASGYKGLGDILRSKSKFHESLHNYTLAVEKWKALGDKQGLGYCYNNIGVVYRNQSNSSKALAFYLLAVELLEEIGDARGIQYISSNIGNIYFEKKDFKTAMKFHQKALRYNEEIADPYSLSHILNNLGLIYAEQKSYPEAMAYFKRAFQTHQSISNKEGMATAALNIGDTFLDLSNLDSAHYYFSEVLRVVDENNDRLSKSYALLGLGETLMLQGKLIEARGIIKRGLKLSQEINYLGNVVIGAEKLSQLENSLGNYRAAYNAQILLKQTSDSIFNEEETAKFVRIQAENDFQAERDSIQFAQEKERLIYKSEIERKNANQRLLILVILLTMIVVGVVFFFYNRLQKLNIEVTQQRDELEKLNKTKSRLFSIIAHDLRSPLGAMTGFAELIQMDVEEKYQLAPESELAKMFRYLKESSLNLQGLLDGLLKWAIKEQGALTIHPESLSLSQCVQENFQIFKHQAQIKVIDLQSKVEEDVSVMADRNSLMTILRNLINNALKFTPEGGKVVVSGRATDGTVVIEVIDTGVGISPEKMQTLFEIDEQKSSRGTKGEAGSGLGLNLVYDFIQINGGSITVESVLDQGTVFKVKLPEAQQR